MPLFKLLAFLPFLTYAQWFFRTYEHDAIYPFDAHYSPAEYAEVPGLTEARIAAADGTELILWQRPADPGRPTVLYLPGNAGNLLGRAGRFRDLAGQGYGLVALSWRGQGGSGGRPDETALTEDGLMIYDHYADEAPVLYGESLGTAVAVKIAAVRRVRALVLESPFTSMPDLADVQFPGENVGPLITQIWDTLDAMPRIVEPLLVLHGADDRLVPLAQGEKVFSEAGSASKRMVEFDHTGHDGVWNEGGREALFTFLDGL